MRETLESSLIQHLVPQPTHDAQPLQHTIIFFGEIATGTPNAYIPDFLDVGVGLRLRQLCT